MNKINGYTLIELLVVISIVGVLTTISYMSYQYLVRKGQRAEAIQTLSAISLAQEKYRSSNLQYGSLTQVWGGVTSTESGNYNLTISNTSATSYTITATAQNDQANDSANGTPCTPLMFASSNTVVTKTPSVC